MARWVAEEGVGIGVGSSGELAVALAAGVDPARIVLHGSAAAVDELRSATAVGVGRIVIDSLMEVAYLACEARRRQRVLIRVTPDIDLHHWVAESAERILSQPLLELVGLRCHIGSQITDPAGYGEAIRRMVAAMADIRAAHGIILTELDIGGGHAVPPPVYALEPDLGELAAVIDDALDQACAAERFPRPRVVVDQGMRDQCPGGGGALPRGVGEVAAARANVRRRGRRHVRQPADRALRHEMRCGPGKPA